MARKTSQTAQVDGDRTKYPWHVTDKRGTRVRHLTWRKALLLELAGAQVWIPRTGAQKKARRQWAAQGIGAN